MHQTVAVVALVPWLVLGASLIGCNASPPKENPPQGAPTRASATAQPFVSLRAAYAPKSLPGCFESREKYPALMDASIKVATAFLSRKEPVFQNAWRANEVSVIMMSFWIEAIEVIWDDANKRINEPSFDRFIERIGHVPAVEVEKEIARQKVPFKHGVFLLCETERLWKGSDFQSSEIAVIEERLKTIPEDVVKKWSAAEGLPEYLTAVWLAQTDQLFHENVFSKELALDILQKMKPVPKG
jgi:hypothetical protein